LVDCLSHASKITELAGYDLSDSHWSHALDNNPFYHELAKEIFFFINRYDGKVPKDVGAGKCLHADVGYVICPHCNTATMKPTGTQATGDDNKDELTCAYLAGYHKGKDEAICIHCNQKILARMKGGE
jgi:hypothetical protein